MATTCRYGAEVFKRWPCGFETSVRTLGSLLHILCHGPMQDDMELEECEVDTAPPSYDVAREPPPTYHMVVLPDEDPAEFMRRFVSDGCDRLVGRRLTYM